MNATRKTLLERMDALVSWTGASNQVKLDMATEGDGLRRYRPMRWLPLLLMACGVILIAAAIALRVPVALFSIAGAFSGLGVAINVNGPLGKSSLEDDEQEAALRKDASLFSLAVLAFANIAGQPIFMMTAALHAWTIARIGSVVFAVLMCNLMWFTSLPTLYASWKLPRLSEG